MKAWSIALSIALTPLAVWGLLEMGYQRGLREAELEHVECLSAAMICANQALHGTTCTPDGPVRYVEWCPAWAVVPCPERGAP